MEDGVFVFLRRRATDVVATFVEAPRMARPSLAASLAAAC